MPPASRPQWQQATALITLGAGGLATGMSIVPQTPADLTTPSSVPPVTLLALQHASAPSVGSDGMMRAAIVHMARHFLRLAQTRSPAEMEAMIWQYASTDGVDHGPSCAAFASLTLELGSRIAGLDSWVTGGTSYPWPVHSWVDGRVDPNPASPGVISVVQDAQSHGRWHALGDGYAPQPGDWVLFDGHVEVVTGYHDGVLHTIGGDSMPNMSVNAHEYPGPLQNQGVAGFVDNGIGMSKAQAGATPRASGGSRAGGGTAGPRSAALGAASATSASVSPSGRSAYPVSPASSGSSSSARRVTTAAAATRQPELAPRVIPVPAIVPQPRFPELSRALPAQGAAPAASRGPGSPPGPRTPAAASPDSPTAPATRVAAGQRQADSLVTRSPAQATAHTQRPAGQHGPQPRPAAVADVPATGLRPARPHRAAPGQAAIPGLFKRVRVHHPGEASALPPYHRHDVLPGGTAMPGTAAQQAFINRVAVGALQTQAKYGVPASVTIAQAIDESAWGQSTLATNDNNLFGIKGTGPAGSDVLPTQEIINGQVVNLSASFQMYRDIAQSIDAHGRLLAQSGYYASAMSQRKDPNAFAQALTGVYATDPEYGAKLIGLMQAYKLYRFDRLASPARDARSTPQGSTARAGQQAPTTGSARQRPSPASSGLSPGHHRTSRPKGPGPIGNPVPVQPGPVLERKPGRPAPVGNPVPVPIGAVPSPEPPPGRTHGTNVSRQGTGQRADAPHSGQAAVLYPGRSARPAPLAHPARPSDLARTSTSSAGHAPGAGGATAQPTGRSSGPAAGRAGTQPRPEGGRADPHPSPGGPTAPGLGNESPNAAIPGIPPVPGPHVGRGSARKPVSWPRRSYRAGRFGQPAVRAHRSGTPAPRAAAAPQPRAADSPAPVTGAPAAAAPAAAAPAAGAPAAGAPAAGAPAAGAPAAGAPVAGAPGAAAGHAGPGKPSHSNPATAPSRRVGAPIEPRAASSQSRNTSSGTSAAHGYPAAASPGSVPPRTTPVAANPAPAATGGPPPGGSDVPGLVQATPATAPTGAHAPTANRAVGAASPWGSAGGSSAAYGSTPVTGATPSAGARLTAYQVHMPPPVREAFVKSAKMPLLRAEHLYRDVASHTGIRWELLAACDWMQCRARRGYSPVYGEKLGTLNPDDTCYRTKSAALEQCASDLVQLSRSVYHLDIATNRELTIRELANVFAAFRWGGLLRQHHTSAMDFPYSVEGLTAGHTHMRWPNIDDRDAPDKPGGRFRQPFGAVPVVLGLNYQALM